MKVAEQLSAHDRLGAHLRDELGIDPRRARAAAAGGVDLGGELRHVRARADPRPPRRAGGLAHPRRSRWSPSPASAPWARFGAYLGGAPLGRAALRVVIGGALAMAVTAVIGRILGVSVG